ncbi:N-acyl-D-amino-acid deacylase family protein [Paracraurococcus ruber]|uniref:Amidohydrolase n=1 Tax=Paracraurococcus ruber TaxID=77675 RepID=A0ABS1D4N2_9PROT|nr:amidohydrolase family protein [Paracraurococcus ruber]MBK1661764.1 amidohydrolase [Paracraurococcus ruber]TDG31867.1 D-aminoacylase [Paracraurococcus ruber]
MADLDLVIRGGTVVDGSGAPAFEADVAIAGGRIVQVGKVAGRGAEEIDAKGKLVTPGFVDIHTHYDAQATWSSRIDSSSYNGVTTALIGNCGVGFAPCRPERRDALVKLMEGVEDLPEVVLAEGLPWTWQSFPEFMDVLGARRWDMDIAAQVTHAPLRVHTMGERAEAHAEATEAEIAEMARLAAEGIRAGALGFSTSRAIAHKTLDGRHIPTLGTPEAELEAIGRAVGQAGASWLQVISDFDEPEDEFARLQRICQASGRPMTFSLLQRESRPWLWQFLLEKIEAANREGARMTGQVMARPVGLMFGFELSQHPFVARPSWQAVAHLPFEAKMQALRDPALKARLLAEETPDPMLQARLNTWDMIFKLGDPPDYEPRPEQSLGHIARERGMDPAALAWDWMMERDGKAILNRPIINYADRDLEAVRTMVEHPQTLMGLGDGGAHVGIICDASSTTHMLAYWTRDRVRGPKLPLEFAVKRLTRDNALALGLADRGLVAAGKKADLNVIDYDRLQIRVPVMQYDLPAGGKRLVQRADGYLATVVNGAVTYRNGEATGALPGRLVRGPQA